MVKKTRVEGKNKIELLTSPISDKITKNIDYVPDILTGHELFILKILISFGNARSTNLIRRNYTTLLFQDICVDVFKENKKERSPYQTRIKEIYDEYHRKSSKENPADINRWLDKQMRRVGLKTPSYETVDSALTSMEKMGIVGRRKEPNKKGKHIWFINPRFKDLWQERRLVIIKEVEKDSKKAILKYDKNLIKFLGIQ
jgi:hypothetical protein